MDNPLFQLENVPVQTGTIAACFNSLSSPNEKIRALERDGQLIRLKRGLYVVDSSVSGKPISTRLCANHIYGPSYVSLQWALRWYGLIPERVTTMTSATTKRSRTFENALGRFSYYQVKPEYFPIGVRSVEENGAFCLMANPEKALCDLILYDSYLPAQSVRRLEQYLAEDIRFDMDALSDLDVGIIEDCAHIGHKGQILNNLAKIIRKI
ncbi:MAG: hypothetical protein E7070_05975 [Bacteroidales bacterium]|jgi:predicted transcriptional regulator of viral defense system|nr:hypothetical protein [Bacteroidales bacterium]